VNNDVVVARSIDRGGEVFLNNTSRQAIIRDGTNAICAYNGKLFYAMPSAGPGQAACIYFSSAFGTNDFTAEYARAFHEQAARDYYMAYSHHVKYLNL